ncbi:PREDICTED: uncharacterized protein LOC105463004 isoform X4 [Wasmannia auropunctata]|uniref:uncharacterized protein LOC105463004 isoform X4 n=1 Tax=Wasmannia auropunctata TaxID=64793 RepID=UPI0005F02829|nr:PREDICTED: uncharacterized protein LOC105463004 isoform X4 [Wasmannia auropunctata]
MFSRAAKSVVNSLGSRRIHISEKNFTKITLIAGAGKISHNLSQLLRNSAKLNALALYDVAAVNRPLPNYNFYDEQSLKPIPLEMLTMEKKSCSGEDSHSNAAINNATQADNNNHQGNNGKSQTEKLVEALYRLPIAEEAPAFNNPLISIEELMPKLQSKEENSARLKTARFRESGITAERRERPSSSMKSAVEIAESGKPIESNQIQTNRDFLSIINSRKQFTGINFVKDFQQDSNSAVNYKDRSDFSVLRKHFVTDPRQFEKSKLSHDDKLGNDDYFPQGEEYEEEIGTENYQLNKKAPSKKPPRVDDNVDDNVDNFQPTMLMFENNKNVNGGPLTRFITRVHFSSIEELSEADRITLMSKKVSNKDAVEKLQTLIERVTEFKRRVFQPNKREVSKTGGHDRRKEGKRDRQQREQEK